MEIIWIWILEVKSTRLNCLREIKCRVNIKRGIKNDFSPLVLFCFVLYFTRASKGVVVAYIELEGLQVSKD